MGVEEDALGWVWSAPHTPQQCTTTIPHFEIIKLLYVLRCSGCAFIMSLFERHYADFVEIGRIQEKFVPIKHPQGPLLWWGIWRSWLHMGERCSSTTTMAQGWFLSSKFLLNGFDSDKIRLREL